MLRMKGFSLIELVIAIAIVGILAAVAYPSYNDSVRKSRRAEAKASLSELAQWMERNYSESFAYNANGAGTAINTGSDSLPFNKTPREGGATIKYYDLTLDSVGDTNFLLKATPVGAQVDDGCGKLTLDHKGVKNIEDADAHYSVETCW